MTNNTNTTSVDTKVNKEAEAITTALTLDWEGMTEEDLRALAQQALIVKLQSGWRKNGIPTDVTVKVTDHKVGTRAPKSAAVIDVAAMTPEQRKALMDKLLAAG